MTLLMRELERQESRVLGALRFVDANTRVALAGPLQVEVPTARLRRNRSGLHVIVQAQALAAHEAAFLQPPALPALGSVALNASVRDPLGHYLPRLARLVLPRDPLPANAALPGSLFRPLDIAMHPSSVAPLGANWAALRVTVRDDASGDALGGALLLVFSGTDIIARGLSDWRGEALVAVPGVPVTTWSDDPDAVVISEIAVQVQAVFDPAAGTRTPVADVQAGRARAALPLVDPDRLEAQRATLPGATLPSLLAAGRSQGLALAIELP